MSYYSKHARLLIGSLLALVCVLYQSLFRAVPGNGDLMTGLPIAKEFAHPGLYSPYDLIVSSGVRGPFHLYKHLGGFLYQNNVNVDLVWHTLFLGFLFLTFLAFWFLSFELTGDTLSSALVLAMITVAHPLRGSLHAAAVPLAAFVTALAAMPFALGALVLLFRRRFFAAMALGSLVFNVHPYVGVLISLAVAAAIFWGSDESLGKRSVIIIGGGLFALPNVVYILSHLPSNFAAVGYDFYEQFRLYAMHAFVEDHWREGYGWFFMNLAGAVWLSRYIDPWKRRVVSVLFAAWFILMAGYVFNSYVTKNTAILLMWLFRATYFIKPIIFIFIVHGMRRWRNELRNSQSSLPWWKPWQLTVAVALLFFSAILPMKLAVVADALALVAYGFVTRQVGQQTILNRFFLNAIQFAGVLSLCVLAGVQLSIFAASREPVENIIVGIIVALAMVLLVVFKKINKSIEGATRLPEPETSASRVLVATLSVLLLHHFVISLNDRRFPFVPDFAGMKERIMMHQAPARTAALMSWARTATPQGSLFIVPPDRWDDFAAFRLVAERSLFVTFVEVNQLSLDASVYHQAHQRVVALGVTFPERREYDTRGYYDLTLDDLQRLFRQEHADYIVVEKERLRGALSTFPSTYHDEYYVVINLHDIAH